MHPYRYGVIASIVEASRRCISYSAHLMSLFQTCSSIFLFLSSNTAHRRQGDLGYAGLHRRPDPEGGRVHQVHAEPKRPRLQQQRQAESCADGGGAGAILSCFCPFGREWWRPFGKRGLLPVGHRWLMPTPYLAFRCP